MKSIVRIGNAQAFWGDRGDAAAELLALEPELDYLTMDYLAEVSMSILATQRARDPALGFARDFVEVVRSLAPYWASGGRCRLIVNAGGLNPRGCAAACVAALQEAGCRKMQIGLVTGDDVLSQLQRAAGIGAASFENLDTQRAIKQIGDRLLTANAYLGATPIVEALDAGADIVITGRVADPSLVVAACQHHFGWEENEFDRLAGATIAGHLVECGTQVTGGISTDWLEVPDKGHLGFPIVEVAKDGSCVVTKPLGTGGRVTEMTVKEQLLYEISDPAKYLSPDASVSFMSLRVEGLDDNRVQVTGASGGSPPETYKVSATYTDGFRAAGSLTVVGRNAVEKATQCGQFVLDRVRASGLELRDSVIECLGSGACSAGIVSAGECFETVLRVAVESDSRDACERFARELMPMVTAGPQGTTGYADGRPRVHTVVRYWPCLIDRTAVSPVVEQIECGETLAALCDQPPSQLPRTVELSAPSDSEERTARTQDNAQHDQLVRTSGARRRLYDVACARSGDKGMHANIGIIARRSEDWDWLQAWLTVERVGAFLSPLAFREIRRYDIPNLHAINFMIYDILSSLRTDAQGKTLGQILLEMPLPDEEQAYNES